MVAFPETRPPGHLPLELSSFVGREREIAEARELLLSGTRLLTLTGPGGCGKTRLALAVAADLAGGFEDGASLVELASLSDPDLVGQAVARSLGVREQPDRSLLQAIARYLHPREVLLLLDNCEHLIEACAALAEVLLRSCPRLKILATSREVLNIAGERALLVPPLTLPEYGAANPAASEAVRLFVERASMAASGFALTPENAAVVARICHRLEGMPLAIELASARTRALSVGQILARLDDCFSLLTGGARTADARQRTLRATMDWSYDLLSEGERTLFRRLSVFAGGFTLEAAEEVCTGEGVDEKEVLDLLARLMDKSLMVISRGAQSDGARYRLQEPVRQYASEKLAEDGETGRLRRRHALFYLRVAESAALAMRDRRQAAWVEKLETENGNLRLTMRWLLEEGEIEGAARLCRGLWLFWMYRGHQGEASRFADAVIERGEALPAGLRAQTLFARALLSFGLEDPALMAQQLEESLPLFRRAGDEAGWALARGALGLPALLRGDFERAEELLGEAVELYRELGDEWGLSATLAYAGMAPLLLGDYGRATRRFEEALALSRELGNKFAGYIPLQNLGLMAQAAGDHERAAESYAEALGFAVDVGNRADAAYCLEGLAGSAAAGGKPERAARLLGAAEALLEAVGGTLYAQAAHNRALHERAVDALRSRMGEEAFAAAWAEGRQMTLERAVEYALEAPPAPPPQDPSGLSAREVEVLRLVAEGLTDAQVAQRLHLSARTVGWHLRSVYRKLGVSSRTAAIREASTRSLI